MVVFSWWFLVECRGSAPEVFRGLPKKLFALLLLFLGWFRAIPDGSYSYEDRSDSNQDVSYVYIHCHLLSFTSNTLPIHLFIVKCLGKVATGNLT